MSDPNNTLTGRDRRDTYPSLLHVDLTANAIYGNMSGIYDGIGNLSPIQVSLTQVKLGSTVFNDKDINFSVATTPSAPSSGLKVYCKSDNKLYTLDSSSIETELGSGGTSLPPDGDYGDIVVSGSGSVWTVDSSVLAPYALTSSISAVGLSGQYSALLSIPDAISAIDNLSPAADKLVYYTGASSAALTDLTSFARTILDDTTASAVRTTIGVVIGTDVQAFDATLTALAAYNTNGFLVQTAADTFTGRSFSNGAYISWTNPAGTAGNPQANFIGPLALADGGTGVSLSDPNADRILFWDDSAGQLTWLTASTGLSISDTNLTATFSNPMTTKGDIIYADVGGPALRLPIGSIGQVLNVDATGIPAWVTIGIGTGTVTGGVSSNGTSAVFDSVTSTSTTLAFNGISSGTNIAVTGGGTNTAITVAISDAELNAIAGLTSAADKLPYFTGSGTAALTDLTTFGRSLIDDANAAAGRTTLDAQQLDATLTSLAAYNTNGLLTQTAADTFTGRTITGTSNQIDVANGSGVSGNPTLSIPYQFNLGSSSTGPSELRLFEDTDSGSNKVTLTVPSTLAADYTLTLPVDDGTVDQVLTTNGSGGLSWTTPAAGTITIGSLYPIMISQFSN